MFDTLRKHLEVSYNKIRKRLYISNFVTLIRPHIALVSALGFFPYDSDLSSNKLAKMNFIASTFAIINITCFCAYGSYNIWSRNWVWREAYVAIHYTSIHYIGLVCLWISFVSSRSKLHLLRMVSAASRGLSPDEFCNTAKWMFAIDVAKLCLFFTYIIDFPTDFWWILSSLISYYMFFVAIATLTLFINCSYVLYRCFRKINTSLEKLKASLATDEPHLLRRVYHSQKNPALLSELKTLRRQHMEFSGVIDASNETFGLQIIVIIALIIMDITFNLYMYVAKNTVDGKIVSVWSMSIEYLSYNCVMLITLAVVCEMVKRQTKLIGFNIHRILVITFDEQIATELELFSMQILQQNNTITAKGLAIDATLLTKIAGIIATYLLILIQFLLIKPC